MTGSSTNSALPLAGLGAVARGTDEAEDQRLVASSRDGCPEAFRSLVERHQQRVHHFCFHYLRDAEEAREACQDTFVRAHRALARYRPRHPFTTWLFRIALNQCRDRLRRRRGPKVALDPGLSCPAPPPDEAAIRRSELAKLDRGLAAMPESDLTILVLSGLEGLSHAECGEILRCSERAAEGRLYRARRRLADWWSREA